MKRIPVGNKKPLSFLKLLAVLLLIASVTLSGCVDEEEDTENFTETDNGKTVSLEKGTVFTLELPKNPTTGYSWELELSEGLDLMGDEYIQDENPHELVGVGGTHFWKIKTNTGGSQKISAVYKRPWEEETGDEERFELTIEVS